MRRVIWSVAAVIVAAGCGPSDVAPEGGGAEDSARLAATPSDPVPSPNTTRPEVTFQLREYAEGRDQWTRGDAILVRLDVDRLRAHGLSADDVMKAVEEGCSFGSPRRVDPPPGVVFVTHLGTPDQHENVILKANAEGEIVRLKDVATLELVRDEP